MTVTTIGLDLAKNVFQLHGVDAEGRTVLQKRLRRNSVLAIFEALPACLVGIEACASAHHWARALSRMGHQVRLMPPQFVKPYVKTNKNDAADAQAICEAVGRPTMRFVPVKSAEQQAVLVLHRTRELMVRQRTMIINALRAHFAEFGVVAAQGAANIRKIVKMLDSVAECPLPEIARMTLGLLVEQLRSLEAGLQRIERELAAWHRNNEASKRLETIPGVGLVTATAIVATVGDAQQFASGRQFAAWLGLVPRQNSSGGKQRLGRISKRGDAYLRRLLVHGARAVLRWAKQKPDGASAWLSDLIARRPVNIATVAYANKTARIAWALLARKETYRRISQPMRA